MDYRGKIEFYFGNVHEKATHSHLRLVVSYPYHPQMQGFLPNTLGHPQNGSKVPKGTALPTTSSLGRRETAAGPRIAIRRLSHLMAILMIYTELSTTVRPPTSCGLLPLRFVRLTSGATNRHFSKVLTISLKPSTQLAGGLSFIRQATATTATLHSMTRLWSTYSDFSSTSLTHPTMRS